MEIDLTKFLNHKDKEVRELALKLQKMFDKVDYEAFVSLSVQLSSFFKQYQQYKIDLFNAEDKPVFEMAYKFFNELKPLIELQDYLRAKLTPQEQEKAKVATSLLEQALQESGAIKE
jgi:exonuclease V gamma subunit